MRVGRRPSALSRRDSTETYGSTVRPLTQRVSEERVCRISGSDALCGLRTRLLYWSHIRDLRLEKFSSLCRAVLRKIPSAVRNKQHPHDRSCTDRDAASR